jgi:hypothetical protein
VSRADLDVCQHEERERQQAQRAGDAEFVDYRGEEVGTATMLADPGHAVRREDHKLDPAGGRCEPAEKTRTVTRFARPQRCDGPHHRVGRRQPVVRAGNERLGSGDGHRRQRGVARNDRRGAEGGQQRRTPDRIGVRRRRSRHRDDADHVLGVPGEEFGPGEVHSECGVLEGVDRQVTGGEQRMRANPLPGQAGIRGGRVASAGTLGRVGGELSSEFQGRRGGGVPTPKTFRRRHVVQRVGDPAVGDKPGPATRPVIDAARRRIRAVHRSSRE